MSYVVAIDLGGTKIDLGLIAPNNAIIARQRIVADTHEGAEKVIARIVDEINVLKRELPPGQTMFAVGMCAPGPLDFETGTLKDPPNIPGLHHAPLAAMLSKKLGVPVKLEHDAKAAALGEYHYGAGRGRGDKKHRHMVYIVAGTGVGGAMIDDGKLIRGVQNSAGEIGHISLDRHGMVCNCGSRGCAQTYIAGPYLVERYKKLAGEKGSRGEGEKNPFPHSPVLPLSRSALTGEDIAQLASQGDEVAQQVLLEAGEALGLLVATLAVTLDVELYVLGGSIAKLGDTLLKPAREIAPKYMLSSLASRVRIELAHLQGDEALLGCAYLVR
jgi:glucokinase